MDFKNALERIKLIAECLDEHDPDKIEMMNIEADYSGLMEWAIKKRTEYMSLENANKELAEIYKIRAARFGNNAENIKEVIGLIMSCANETSYKGIAGTVTKKTNPSKPIVIDENLVPDAYKKKIIDKTAINEAIKNGAIIDGVSFDNGSESIIVRIR